MAREIEAKVMEAAGAAPRRTDVAAGGVERRERRERREGEGGRRSGAPPDAEAGGPGASPDAEAAASVAPLGRAA